MERDQFNYPKAAEWYKKILCLFEFDQKLDLASRDWFWEHRKAFDPALQLLQLKNHCVDKKLIFFGAGPSLHTTLNLHLPFLKTNRNDFFFIAADGAARGLLEFGLIPDVVVTDLDGLIPNQIEYLLSVKTLCVIHAHGDNMNKLQAIENLLSSHEYIIGSTQNEPRWPLINSGGFTDGDRALYFMHHVVPQSQPFYLIGYDFGDKIAKYSKPYYTEDMPLTPMKQKKNQIAEELIQNLREKENRVIEKYKW